MVDTVDKRTVHGETVYVFMGSTYNADGYLLKQMNIKSLVCIQRDTPYYPIGNYRSYSNY